MTRVSSPAPALDTGALAELQAALEAGAGPAEALAATCREGPLAGVAREVALGRGLADVALSIDTGAAAGDLLVRALALAERTGCGAAIAVEQALSAIRDEAALARLIDVRTAQARGTAVVLAAVPVVTWVVLVAADPRTLGFYRTPIGILTAGLAVALAVTSWRWMRRLTTACARASASADPLHAVGSRRPGRRATVPAAGGAAELVELVAVATGTGLSTIAALEEVERIAPPAASEVLQPITSRLAGGALLADAFAGSPLQRLGEVLAAGLRWGAPVERPLRHLADDLRAERRAAAEVAAERLQLTLVFPTTLLTLPAFVLGVVPPMLWTTLQR